jgi:hypothetical protein
MVTLPYDSVKAIPIPLPVVVVVVVILDGCDPIGRVGGD